MTSSNETVEGYVVDTVCIRKYPLADRLDRAREHTKHCATMGHCVESGYGLINDQNQLALLDPKATPLVVEAIEGSERDHDIRLRATREMRDHEMQTTAVVEVAQEEA